MISISALNLSGCSTRPPLAAHEDYAEEMKLRKPDASKVAQGQGVRLSEAILKRLNSEPISKERMALLAAIQKGQGRKNNAIAFDECEKKFDSAPECVFLKPDWADKFFEDDSDVDPSDAEIALKASQRNQAVKLTRAFKKKHASVIDKIRQNLIAGNLAPVEGQIEGDIYRALKKVTTWQKEIDELAVKLVSESTCRDPEVYVYLGLKGEEFFPDEDKTKKVLQLYRKADECNLQNATNKYVQLARFRLGLLSVVAHDCVEAEKVFGRLSKMGVNDYSTRAYYWSAYCARVASKKEEFLSSFDELFRMNPLGYHTLSINNGDSVLVENITRPIDPIVKPRTAIDGQYNVWIHLLEDYDQLQDLAMVRRLLTPARKNPEYLLKLEPGVRLYLSTFAYRSKDTISLFRMLDSVFRTQSEYVVDSTLRLFYPLKYLESIQAEAKKVRPLLIAALIRQESAFQEEVKSRVGAMGLMQLMPATARLMDRKVKRSQLLKADVNIRIGVRYFEALVDRYSGDVELALAAYNAGSEVVDRWQKRYPTGNRLLFLDLMPYAETRNYVTLIGRNYFWYTRIYGDQIKDSNGIAQSAHPTEFRGMKSE